MGFAKVFSYLTSIWYYLNTFLNSTLSHSLEREVRGRGLFQGELLPKTLYRGNLKKLGLLGYQYRNSKLEVHNQFKNLCSKIVQSLCMYHWSQLPEYRTVETEFKLGLLVANPG